MVDKGLYKQIKINEVTENKKIRKNEGKRKEENPIIPI